MSTESRFDDLEALWHAARCLGGLLLRELDAASLERLARPEVREALEALGLDVPVDSASIDELAADFHDALLRPAEGGPLVQSLWTQGTYEGDSAATLRKLAGAAGLELSNAAARGAAPDHLGCILLLWAETRTTRPDVAERLERDHLGWALAPLSRLGSGQGFYAGLARVVRRWIEQLPSLEAAIR